MGTRALLFSLHLVFLNCINCISKCNDGDYNFQLIPKELLANANGVVRNKSTTITINSDNKVVIEDTLVLTILNENGLKSASLIIPYDDFSKISNIQGELFNSNGDRVRKIKSEEIYDLSANSPWTLFSDTRIKVIHLIYNQYPFTIRYSYQKKIESYITPPVWNLFPHSYFSVQTANLSINADHSVKLKYKEFNINPAKSANNKSYSHYDWSISNFAALIEEDNSPESLILYPTVIYFPEIFSIEKNTGDFSNWKTFGDFYHHLNSGSSDLNIDAQKEIKNLIAGVSNDKEKVKRLYQWMQYQTRYVSIQKGIGGWKSFDANYVYKNKLGDCKALVNYMHAALKQINITSYPVLIAAGNENKYFDQAFPYNYFNHVILCVPIGADTIWLECTNRNQPFNYLGSFTSNRYGLLISENASNLIHTPVYSTEINRTELTGKIQITESGNSFCSIMITKSGEMQDEIRAYQFETSGNQKTDWVRSQISVADYELKSFNFHQITKDSSLSAIDLEFNSFSLCGVSGNRMFIHSKLIKNELEGLSFLENRKFPFEIQKETMEIDSIIIQIPSGYIPESIDKLESFSCPAGKFEYFLKYNKTESTFLLKKIIYLKRTIISPDQYEEWVNFRNKVNETIKNSIVCVKS